MIPADDSACVLVRSDLRPSTYRVFAEEAKRRGVEVGVLLSRLADRAAGIPDLPPAPVVVPVTKPRRRHTRSTIGPEVDAKIRELNAQRMSDSKIARELGLKQPTVSLHRRRMGLESPTPRIGGRRRAA